MSGEEEGLLFFIGHPNTPVKPGQVMDGKQFEGGPVPGEGLPMFLAVEDAVRLLQWRELQMQ